MRYKATIDLYVELPDELPVLGLSSTETAEAMLADGIGDTLRSIVDGEFIIDWTYAPREAGGYHYAEPYEGLTPEEDFQASKPVDA